MHADSNPVSTDAISFATFLRAFLLRCWASCPSIPSIAVAELAEVAASVPGASRFARFFAFLEEPVWAFLKRNDVKKLAEASSDCNEKPICSTLLANDSVSGKRDDTSEISSRPPGTKHRLASTINFGQSVPMSARQKTAMSNEPSANGTLEILAAVTQ